MKIPSRIVFHGFDRSTALEQSIHEHIAKLEKFSEHLVGCQVSMHANQHRSSKNKLFQVRIVCHVPGKSLVVSHDRHNKPSHEDPYQAVRDGFRAMTRQIEDWERKIRGDVKQHEPVPRATVAIIDHAQAHGFLETVDGRQIYFHRNSVLSGNFDQLEVGAPVRFAEEQGDEGPQASTVFA